MVKKGGRMIGYFVEQIKRIPEYFFSVLVLEFYLVMSIVEQRNRLYLEQHSPSDDDSVDSQSY